MNILISTLGATWNIIPETIGFINYRENDFYKNHPNLSAINKAREVGFGCEEADELWLIATDKPSVLKGCNHFNSTYEDYLAIKKWNSNCGELVKRVRLWVLDGVADITNENEADQFHDLTLQVVAYAKQQSEGGKIFLSLACGRKTMSADMQDAAYCFGCDAMIHILGEPLKSDLGAVLSQDDCLKTNPLYLGRYKENDAISGYVVPEFEKAEVIKAKPGVLFLDSIRKLQDEAKYFFTSYYLDQENDNHNNFQILYTLPLNKIRQLKETKIGIYEEKQQKELAYLHQLPKTELHCHLGGVLDCNEMIEVAKCYESEINQEKERNNLFAKWCDSFHVDDFKTPTDGWKEWRRQLSVSLNTKAYLINAVMLLKYEDCVASLDELLYGKYLDDSLFRAIDIVPYENLGDLQGSALLRSEESIRRTVRILLKKAERENVMYIEVRCSPLNYVGELNQQQVLQCILEELDNDKNPMRKSLLLIATRHGDLQKIDDSIQLMHDMENESLFKKYFRGFDLAGNEASKSPAELHDKFLDVLKECRNITIHAGETRDEKSIWQAVYYLNAERIGHGLTLKNNPDLINKFLERKIGIEMCPSSNYQIKNFKDSYIPESQDGEVYPLKEYLEKELRVCINTDNPGISRTDFTNELHRAARLTPGGLSLWNMFQLIYNGFLLSFYPYEEKRKMIKEVEQMIGQLIKENKI